MNRDMTQLNRKRILGAAAVLVMLVLGISLYSGSGDASDGDGAPQAMSVQTVTVEPQLIQLWKPFSGHIVAVDHADIRPQVDGRITEILFEDGQHVEKGDVLMVIDPRPYEAALEQAEAALKAAETQAVLAEKEYKRAQKLVKTAAISRSSYDSRVNNRATANAAVKGAKARVESAEIELDYAHVKAPISGKVSRAEITEGNLVEAGAGAPLLTSIVGDESVYVDFEVDEQTYLKTVRSPRSGDGDSEIEVKLKLSNDLEYTGIVHSFDNRIDANSGTIRARAIFANDDKILLPGMSVSVLMGSAEAQKHIVLTERAIGTDQDRKFVYVIGDDGHATYREITIGDSIGGQRIVTSGLNDGDLVITEGIVRIRPGMAVTPKSAQQDSVEMTPDTAE